MFTLYDNKKNTVQPITLQERKLLHHKKVYSIFRAQTVYNKMFTLIYEATSLSWVNHEEHGNLIHKWDLNGTLKHPKGP